LAGPLPYVERCRILTAGGKESETRSRFLVRVGSDGGARPLRRRSRRPWPR
jgi:hypothetical protein